MNVREADLIGIGRKFQLETSYGEHVVIVIHDDGRRELYSYNPAENETTGIMTLDDEDRSLLAPAAPAERLGSLLSVALALVVAESGHAVCLSASAVGRTVAREGSLATSLPTRGVGTRGRCTPASRPCVKVFHSRGKPCGCCGKPGSRRDYSRK